MTTNVSPTRAEVLDTEYADALLLSDEDLSKSARLHACGNSLRKRYFRNEDVEDICKAARAHDEAVRLTADSHSNKPRYLHILAATYRALYYHNGDVEDIQKAVRSDEEAVRLIPDDNPLRSDALSGLALSSKIRFERLNQVADINRVISLYEEGLRLTPDGPKKPAYLSSLGNSFEMRFGHFGDIGDLHKAILAHEEAVKLTHDDHPDKADILGDYGDSLRLRFQHIGELADLHKAISAHHDAVQLTPHGDWQKAGHLSSLGNSLITRFNHFGDVGDADKAIFAYGQAVQLTPGQAKSTNLALLGRAYWIRGSSHKEGSDGFWESTLSSWPQFAYLKDATDFDRAISAIEMAMDLLPDGDPSWPNLLSNLSAALQRRFAHDGNSSDIQKAILSQTAALKMEPDSDPAKSIHLNYLGVLLNTRFAHSGDTNDIDESIKAHDKAVRLTLDGEPDKPSRQVGLGDSLWERFQRFGDVTDFNKAIVQYMHAAESPVGPPLKRFEAACKWAEHMEGTSDTSSFRAYSRALELLPQVVWHGLSIAERHGKLVEIGDIVRAAAAAAIKAEKYEAALEWLEQGRSIVWGQLLNLRSPIDELHDKAPNLAHDLAQVTMQLEFTSTRDSVVESNNPLSTEQVIRKQHGLALKYEELVAAARRIEGFEDFLLPKTVSQLRRAARSGPVVVINVHEEHSDALILMPDQEDSTQELIHIPLHDHLYLHAQKLQVSLGKLTLPVDLRRRGARHSRKASRMKGDDHTFKWILSELWKYVVEPVLIRLDYPISQAGDPPRVWWCATGPLSFLPIHAAGLYDKKGDGSSIADFVTSSYTPTLTALLNTRPTTRHDRFRLLAISQPFTPGQDPLPNTKEELLRIQQHTGKFSVTCREGEEATVERVAQDMKECSWVHLASHGIQDATDPMKSALLLHDGCLELSEIIKTPLPHADFAFLSACQTATGAKHLSEEAVHLAAGMLLAGYHGVIATMWSIQDNEAPRVADMVYERLFEGQQPDRTRAAHALHHAVQCLRKQNVSFRSWVPFIHVGW